jgi:hypothetical protein
LSVARTVNDGKKKSRRQKNRIQESGVRSQKNKAENRYDRFAFILSPDFWILTPVFCILLFMLDSRGRSGAGLVVFLLLVSLTVASCQALKKLTGGGDIDEANQLNRSAGEDIREIERIVKENKDKESAVSRALNAGDTDAAKRIMDDSVKAIDRGLEKGQSAADKLNKASTLDLDQTIKEYLSLRAQSVNKAIEAFRELRRGILTFRDAIGSTDKAATEKAKNEIQQSSEKFDKLISEAERLGRQADEIARRNPDKIKPGQ